MVFDDGTLLHDRAFRLLLCLLGNIFRFLCFLFRFLLIRGVRVQHVQIAEGNRPDIGIGLPGRQHQLPVGVIIPDGHDAAGAVVFRFLRGVSGPADHRFSRGVIIALQDFLPVRVVYVPDFVVLVFPVHGFAVQPVAFAGLLLCLPGVPDLVRVLAVDEMFPVGGVEGATDGVPVFVVGIYHPGISCGAVDQRSSVGVVIGDLLRQVVLQPVVGNRVSVGAAHRFPVLIKVSSVRQISAVVILILHGSVSKLRVDHRPVLVIVELFRRDAADLDIDPLHPAVAVRDKAAHAFPDVVLCFNDPAPEPEGLLNAAVSLVREIQAAVRLVIVFQPYGRVARHRIAVNHPRVSLRPGNQLSVRPVVIRGLDLAVFIFGYHRRVPGFGIVVRFSVFIEIGGPAGILSGIIIFNPGIAVRPGRRIVLRVVPAVAEQPAYIADHPVFGKPVGSDDVSRRVVLPGFIMLPLGIFADLPGISLRPVHELSVRAVVAAFRQIPDAVPAGPVGKSLVPVNQVPLRVQQFFFSNLLFIPVGVPDGGVSLVRRYNRLPLRVREGFEGCQFGPRIHRVHNQQIGGQLRRGRTKEQQS